jgi:hypothetical protein
MTPSPRSVLQMTCREATRPQGRAAGPDGGGVWLGLGGHMAADRLGTNGGRRGGRSYGGSDGRRGRAGVCRFRNRGVLRRNEPCPLAVYGQALVAEAAMAPIERVFLLLAMTGLVGLVSSLAYLLAS